MKNFLRALRHALPYKGRLLISLVAALCAAVLWSLNFTAIYPVLKILGNDQSLQEWVDTRIAETQRQIEKLQPESEHLEKEFEEVNKWPDGAGKDERLNHLSGALARCESRLKSARTSIWRYQLAKSYILRYLPNDRFQTLAWLIGLVVIAVAVKGFFEFWQESMVGSVVNLSLYDLRNRFYRNVIHLDVNHFSDDGTHELMARFTNDMELLGLGAKTLFGKVVAEPLKAICCVAVASWYSWQLTLMFLVLVPVAVVLLTRVGRIMKRATRRLLERMSNIYKILQETFIGIRVVKAFTMEHYERRRFRLATRDYYRKAMMVVNIDALADPVVELLGVAAVALALLCGAYLVLTHETRIFGLRMVEQPMDVETLLTLYAALAAIADPVRKLSSVYTRLQSGAAAADRIFNYLDRQPRVTANTISHRLERHHESIEFRDVCFSYKPGQPILTNVHLRCRYGETIALVGKNGCGKTTLVNLIPRFFDPDHGSVLIDGHDTRNVNLRSLRKQVGLVTQDAILFDDSFHNNIAYGNRRAKREEVEAAARQAHAHEFIMSKGGYEVRVGESAMQISGGQKQRLALARAILRDPSILILDEFTSQIDAESEADIHQALRDFRRGRTTFIITHRLNTLEVADRIVVLEASHIVAVGTHAELLKTCNVYQRLHDAHFLRQAA